LTHSASLTNVTSPIRIRALEQHDADAWAALRRDALERHPLSFGASVPDDATRLVSFVRERMAEDESSIFGAFSGDQLRGIVGLMRERGKKERHKAFIWGMYVEPDARSVGAGTALMMASLARAHKWHGVEQVHLSVSDRASDARKLYQRLGFVAWGVEPHAIGWNGEFADETHMVLELAPRDPR
jgi:RimJ/RimL family protein N-acetyltransferase